jgi:group I intron endonuclease
MAIPSISGIYRIRNIVDGKVYIGSAINFRVRWNQHRCLLRQGKHFCKHLQAAWNKRGAHAFVYEIIEACENERLIEREQHWLDAIKSYDRSFGYNSRLKAENQLGLRHSEASKLKVSQTKKGTPSWNKGVPMSETAKQKMILAKTGQKQSLETRERRAAAMRGRKRPPEVGAKISQTRRRLGYRPSEAARKAASELRKGQPSPMAGKKHSAATIAKLREAARRPRSQAQLAHLAKINAIRKGQPSPRKGKLQTSAHRQAVSAAVKAWWAKRKATDPQIPIL